MTQQHRRQQLVGSWTTALALAEVLAIGACMVLLYTLAKKIDVTSQVQMEIVERLAERVEAERQL